LNPRNLPIKVDETLRKNQFLIEVLLPTIPDDVIKKVFDKVLPPVEPNQIQVEPSQIQVEPSQIQVELNDKQKTREALIIRKKSTVPPSEQKEMTAKSHDEIMEIMNQKNSSDSQLPTTDDDSQEPKKEQFSRKSSPALKPEIMESILTGDLINLCQKIQTRLDWYFDIDLYTPTGINERQELRNKVIKFETTTISSFANQFNQIFTLLEHQHFQNTLSSAKNRDYSIIYKEFKSSDSLEDKISLLTELKMIPSSWLPKQHIYNKPKKVTPTISTKVRTSNDKGE